MLVCQAQLTTSVQQLRAAVDVMETQARQRQLLEAVSRVEVEQLRHETQDLAAISDERSKIRKMQPHSSPQVFTLISVVSLCGSLV